MDGKVVSILFLMMILWGGFASPGVTPRPAAPGVTPRPAAPGVTPRPAADQARRRATFDRFDEDGDGKWRKRDLAKRLGEFAAGQSIGNINLDGYFAKAAFLIASKPLMTKFDEDGDGRMNYQEYIQMMAKWDELVPDIVKSTLKQIMG